MTTNDEPISELDERVDDLVRALALLPPPTLTKIIDGMRAHEEVAARLGPGFPGVVDVIAAADFRKALLAVAVEVQNLRNSTMGA